MERWFSFAAASLIFAGTGHAACIDVSKPENAVALDGELIEATVAGPPNYEDTAKGDAAETIYILKLPRPICIDDGGEFADPSENFDQVHVYAGNELMLKMLKRKAGKMVHIEGNGFAAETIHHRRPLVVSVTAVK